MSPDSECIRRAREPSEPPDGWCEERGPACGAAGCGEARFLRHSGARNACAGWGAGEDRTHGASGGRGDAPAAAGEGACGGGFAGRERARGPAARGGGCSEARFLRRKGARNAHAVRGAGQGRIHGASGGRGDAPAAAGNGRTRRGLCRAGEGAWSGGMRRCMPQAAFLAPFRRSKRLRGVGVRGRTAPMARAVGAKRKKRGPCRRARAPLCLPRDEKNFFCQRNPFYQ